MSKNELTTPNIETTPVTPVTSDVLTQTDISYSMKISKQVLIKELNAQIPVLSKEFDTLQEKGSTILKTEDVRLLLQQELKKGINGDRSISKLRLGVNAVTGNRTASNWAFLQGDDCIYAAVKLCSLDYQRYRSYEYHEADTITVGYDFHVGLRDEKDFAVAEKGDRDDENEFNSGYQCEVAIPAEIRLELMEIAGYAKRMVEVGEQLNDLRDKLRNMDQTMEELESQLLTDELNRTERGQRVLGVTTQIVNQVLGKEVMPKLVADDSKS